MMDEGWNEICISHELLDGSLGSFGSRAGQTTEDYHKIHICADCPSLNAIVVKRALCMDENLMETQTRRTVTK
jgi:hypothetical protein